jgi:hypothetical protein
MYLVYRAPLTKANYKKALTKIKRENLDFYFEVSAMGDFIYNYANNNKDLVKTSFYDEIRLDLERIVSRELGLNTYTKRIKVKRNGKTHIRVIKVRPKFAWDN